MLIYSVIMFLESKHWPLWGILAEPASD